MLRAKLRAKLSAKLSAKLRPAFSSSSMKKNKKSKKKNKKKKRTPAPPGNVRPNSFVPRAPKGTHAGESSLASTKCHCLSS